MKDLLLTFLLSKNSWDSVQIYDISAKKWYNQTTTGQVKSRTQFCATVQYDAAMSSYAIYVLGGVDLSGKDAMTDVYVCRSPAMAPTSLPLQSQLTPT